MKIYAYDIRRLSLKSNRGMMDCKKALKMFDGDAEKAYQWLLENTKERENDEDVIEESILIEKIEVEENFTHEERIQKGLEFLRAKKYKEFKNILKPIAESNKDAALLLMNDSYRNKIALGDYLEYKEMAMKLQHPLAFYHEGILALKQIHHHEIAFSNFVKAYQYGYSEAKNYIYKLYDVLKEKYNKRNIYQYHSMDVDPFMFSCIYNETIKEHYIKYLKDQCVSEKLIRMWNYQNFQNKTRKILADFKFNTILYNIFKSNDSLTYTTKNGVVDFDEGMRTLVCSCDEDIINYFNQTFDSIIISTFPSIGFEVEPLMKMKIYNRLDIKEYLMNHYYMSHLNNVFKNVHAERIIDSLKLYEPYRKNKLITQQAESIAFLQSQIIAYEECMRLHKQTCNRFLALHFLWAMSEKTSFHFYDYLQMAKEEILSLDKQFIAIRDAYLEQLKLSEYKNKLWCQGVHYSEQRRIAYLRNKLIWNTKYNLDIHETKLKEMINKNHFDVFIEDIIAYSISQDENIFILSKDKLYSNHFKKSVSLKDLICLKMDEQRRVYALYRSNEIQIIIREKGVGLVSLIESINELVLYL